MPVIASARWFSGVLHLSCYMSSVLLGQQCWLSGLAHLVHTKSQDKSHFYVPPAPVTAFPLCHGALRPRADLQPPSKQLNLPQVSPAAGVTRVLQPDHDPARTGGGDGEAELCQEWARGTRQRSHCRAGTDTCRSFQPQSSWMTGSPKAWETCRGRWPAPTASPSCLAYAKYNKMH